ncbi:FtsW/RodA/SpoVE family cell cycle protein [Rarobacter incanus]|uniref:Cell elongation-specific peptidoglycan biosynthesis regulator RodA n=1 Tax=Rarobacter incanus TaxID=153494 RepID=A0A542SPZ9_9MICO|nr:FtsW/RodA/SpoVE family cell cycle protein [Rarobacter incanus]TQK76648.1 cell elongation-specific peptidoglycan biosynthesis regulator RodA [Rarobacter incanus]
MATVEPTPVPRRRGSEFFLILFALILGVGAYALVGLATSGGLPATFYRDAGVLVILTVGMHLAVRKFAPYADPIILPITIALNGIGLAMIYQLDPMVSAKNIAFKQTLWTLISMAAAVSLLAVLRDHRTLRRYTYVALLAAAGLLMLPLIPGIGTEIHGARIWIHVGPLSFQPAELAKIAFAVFCAGYLVTNRDTLALAGRKVLGLQLPRLRDFGPLLLALGASLAVLVFQRDLGTSLLFLGIFLAMLYIATERVSWIIIGLGLFGVGTLTAIKLFGHVARRFDGWLHAMDDSVYYAVGGSGQLVNGLFGMANGGLLGTGWGDGYPHLTPFSYSDFIFASLGEVLGLTGLFAIVIAYVILVQRGFRIALGTRDGFGKLLAGGLSFAIAWQCFVVIGGVTRLIPVTGLTVPFLAYGGSSLLANWLIIALLIRISDNARRPHPLPLRAARAANEAVPA